MTEQDLVYDGNLNEAHAALGEADYWDRDAWEDRRDFDYAMIEFFMREMGFVERNGKTYKQGGLDAGFDWDKGWR